MITDADNYVVSLPQRFSVRNMTFIASAEASPLYPIGGMANPAKRDAQRKKLRVLCLPLQMGFPGLFFTQNLPIAGAHIMTLHEPCPLLHRFDTKKAETYPRIW